MQILLINLRVCKNFRSLFLPKRCIIYAVKVLEEQNMPLAGTR